MEYVKLNNGVMMLSVYQIPKKDTKSSLFFNHQDLKMVKWFDNMIKVRRDKI